jgi:glycosyltransferase involved in cell wall biosynthesis
MLSVIIICKDEEKNIRECLESVSWADEIIVLDSGSNDNTVSICQEFTDQVHITDWPGFGKQKQRALELATQPWVLSIDADERITQESKNEILETINRADAVDGYHLPRSSNFCGRFMRHSGWYPDYVLRLFRRESARFTDDVVHERVICNGTSANLKHPILHYTYDSLDQAVEKANLYSTLGAEKLYKEGKQSSISKAFLKGFWAFLRTYLFRQGFRDGKHGFLLAVVNAEATYNKYAKLALKTQLNLSSDKKH